MFSAFFLPMELSQKERPLGIDLPYVNTVNDYHDMGKQPVNTQNRFGNELRFFEPFVGGDFITEGTIRSLWDMSQPKAGSNYPLVGASFEAGQWGITL